MSANVRIAWLAVPLQVAALLVAAPLGPTAFAAEPDVQLSGMTRHDDLAVLDPELLGESYDQLVREIGTLIANKPMYAAETLGLYGFEFGIYDQFVLTEARDRKGEPSPWARASPDETSPPYRMVPGFSARKGLPASTELGIHMGWIGMSNTAAVGGYGRLGVLEGYKPWPDVTLQLGWSGYVGNDELDARTLDLGVTVGSNYSVGGLPGVNTAQISPWANFTTLRVSAAPGVDPETAAEIGARTFQNGLPAGEASEPLVLPQFGGGVQFVASNVYARLALTWAPASIPTLTTGLGVSL